MNSNANLAGILWMLFGMLTFALGDTFLKLLAGALPVGQILLLSGAGGAVIFGVLAVQQRASDWWARLRHPVVLARTVMEAGAATGFVLAFAAAPLSTIAAIMQSNPLLVTLGAAIWLREPVGPHRWTAIFLGFLGMLLVIRPWGAGFEPGALYAVIGVTCLSIRDLLTRFLPAETPTVQLGVYAMAILVPTGLILQVVQGTAFQSMDGTQALILLGATVMVPLGFFAVTLSIRLGEVSAVAPFRYARLVFALILAMLVFGERPDMMTYLGALVIVLSGLYAIWRESLRRKTTP